MIKSIIFVGAGPIRFEEYVSWGAELKFKYMNRKPVFGGSERMTKEWMGLLAMALEWCV